jgi:microcystin-dependent protein
VKELLNEKENSQIMASQPYLGAIFMFAGNFAPRGFQLCAGQVLAISQNTALFSILGTTYGGNGTTTFALPDLRGRAPIGAGNGTGLSPVVLGQQGGSQNVSILASNMPAHNHLVNVSTVLAAQASPSNNFLAPPVDSTPAAGTGYNTTPTGGATLAQTAVSIAGQGLPVSVQNPYLGINYIIAVQGIFPSRN